MIKIPSADPPAGSLDLVNNSPKCHVNLEAIRYSRGRLEILNQLLLPLKTEYLVVNSVLDGFDAIRTMKVRGAPAIAIVGCLSLAIELHARVFTRVEELVGFCVASLDHLVDARPTAVNMRTAADQLKALALSLLPQNDTSNGDGTESDNERLMRVHAAKEQILAMIETMLSKDLADNVALGDFGAADMLKRCPKDSLSILTHCNTGSLATAGYGTALGVVRSLSKLGKLDHVYFNETRPYNQGSRLTAYELITEKIPSTLLCDSAAGWLMASGKVDCIVTGADRVAANVGTVALAGTFMLAVLAKHHGIPFYIAAPVTTCDLSIPSGREIVIEERDSREITHHQGSQISPDGVQCWNPAFDVTPAELITGGIITEKGVFPPNELRTALKSG